MTVLWRSFGIALGGTVLLGGLYPFFMMVIGNFFFPYTSQGSFLIFDNQKRGSEWIAQSFTEESYLTSRPSAAFYNAAASAGSTLSPASLTFKEELAQRAVDYRHVNKVPAEILIPIDAVTTSGSGLDPEISLKNALLQATRIANARGLSERQVRNIIIDHSSRTLSDRLFQRRVNVLECNMAIEQFHRYMQYGFSDQANE